MAADRLLLGSDVDSSIGFLLFIWSLMPFLYAILLFCMLHGIMTNTKRTNELLAKLISFEDPSPDPASTKSFVRPPLPRRTLDSVPVEELGSISFTQLHKEPAREPRKFTTLKFGSAHNETDEEIEPEPGKDGNGPLHPEQPRSDQ
jgi:hypothetical protein